MIFTLYRRAILPLTLFLYRVLLPALPEKLKTTWRERQDWRPGEKTDQPVILIHAASGEIEYAKPVLRALRKGWPQVRLVVSYFSPSAHRLHRGLEVDEIVPFPFDRAREVRQFLDHYSPKIVLIARSDLWPEFLHQCRERGIPTALFSATASLETSNPLALSLRKFCLSELSWIGCVSAADTAAFQQLTSTPVLTLGDTRYEQTLERLRNAKKLSCEKSGDLQKKFCVLGSTWPEDDQIWFEFLRENQSSQIRFVWAPHEFSEEKLASLEKKFVEFGKTVQRFSKTSQWTSDILLVDQIGVLAELYTWADFAFVGGSFVRKVHSVMEPLAAGRPVLVGPQHRNNREAIEFQGVRLQPGLSAVTTVHNSADIVNWFEHFRNVDPEQIHTRISREIEQRAIATQKLVELLAIDRTIAMR